MKVNLEQILKAIEVFPVAVIISDANGQIVLTNGRTEEIFGYPRGELIGQMVEVLMPERYRERHAQYRSDYSRAPRTRLMGLGLDLVGRRKDGTQFPIEVGLSAAETDDGSVTVALVHDISERKDQAETVSKVNRRLIQAHEEERKRIGRELHDDIGQRL